MTARVLDPVERLYWLDVYWNHLRGDAPLPLARDLRPEDIPYALGHVALVEAEHGTGRFRYRLVGTELTELWGRELRGAYVDETYGFAIRQEVLGAYRRVVRTGRPLGRTRIFGLRTTMLGYRRLMLPFATEAGPPDQVNLVAVAIFPTSKRIRKRADWEAVVEHDSWIAWADGFARGPRRKRGPASIAHGSA